MRCRAIRPAPAAGTHNYEALSLSDPPVSPHVYIETEKGTIEIELDVLDAPRTCENFIALVRKGYFDGLTFHRVVAELRGAGRRSARRRRRAGPAIRFATS